MVQLREKEATTRAFVEQARALKAALAPLGVPLAINDRLDVALAVDADGLHVGQDDMPVEEARRLMGPGKFIGLSITAVDQVLRPDAAGRRLSRRRADLCAADQERRRGAARNRRPAAGCAA